MLKVVSLFWQANVKSQDFSRCYDETWVEKLQRGFARNLTVEHEFVLYTDREREYDADVTQVVVDGLGQNGYSDCIRPYEMGDPMILVGLDTIVTGNCDHLAQYCLEQDVILLPRDPYKMERACNGVALIPGGWQEIADRHTGQNDMEWMRSFPHLFIDDRWPGHVQSFKGRVRDGGLRDTRICYFHGREKPHELSGVPWVRQHWI